MVILIVRCVVRPVWCSFFNKLITLSQDLFVAIHKNDRKRYLTDRHLARWLLWPVTSLYSRIDWWYYWYHHNITNGGYLNVLLLIFLGRVLTTLLCFGSECSGGGIFAPMLALGTLFGYAFGLIAAAFFPELNIEPGMFAIAGMGALFAATVRAPITGIL